jgi:hypothetical protein
MKQQQINIVLIILGLILITAGLSSATIITGQGSSYNFNITGCNAQPETPLNCSPATIRYECNITDPTFINQVNFRINGIDYTTTQNSTSPFQFYYLYSKPQETTTNNNPLTFDRQQIIDTNNFGVNAYQIIYINHTCEVCSQSYTKTYLTNCSTSDTRIAQYTSSNESCAVSYNDTEYCNYCSEEIENTFGTCINGTQTISYTDNNYNTCCAITGMGSDCSIYGLFNTTQSCDTYQKDFNCTLDQTPVLHDKMNVVCQLNDPEPQDCVINIYQQNGNQRLLMQTTPERKVTTDSFFWARENEERTSFTNTQHLLNAYYTQKEIRVATPYDLEVVCSNNVTTTKYTTTITPQYPLPDQTSHRLTWIKDNFAYVFITFIVGVIIMYFFIWLIGKLRGN